MRPDEHKKKKNEQYKKKHGIKSNPGKSQGKINDTPKKQQAPKQVIPVPTPKEREYEEDNPVDNARPVFQKRKVESNWDRYTETPPSAREEHELIGADFRELLAGASTSFSQFRFKDEQEWDTEEASSSASHFLSIDCDALQGVLSCVPLHERLQVDTKHFQESQLNKFLDHAELNKKNHERVAAPSTRDTSSDKDQGLLDSAVAASPSHTQPHSPTQNTELSDAENTNSGSKSVVEDTDELDALLSNSVTQTNKQTAFKTNDLEEITKELNVASLNNHAVQSKEVSKEPLEHTPSHLKTLNLEKTGSGDKAKPMELTDELDELLNLDGGQLASMTDTLIPAPASSNGVKTERLEDWLDSVLED